MSRTLAVLSVVMLAGCGVSSTGPEAFNHPAFAAESYTESDVAVPFTRGVQIPCSRNGLEIVVFTGTQHVLLHQSVAATGRSAIKLQTNGQGITGTGLVTGDTYRLGGMTTDMYQLPLGTPYPASYTYVNNFPITSAGATGNVVAHETLRVEWDAWGNGTVTVVNFNAECK